MKNLTTTSIPTNSIAINNQSVKLIYLVDEYGLPIGDIDIEDMDYWINTLDIPEEWE